MAEAAITKRPFSEVDLNDPFFDDLKASYAEFSTWFQKKSTEKAYVAYNNNSLQAFLYVKKETDTVNDVIPPIESPCLKVGTFKVNAHGTKLGERFVKLIIDEMFEASLNYAYVTIFERHESLILILEKYGFVKYGEKNTINGTELVFLKTIPTKTENIYFDYPVLKATDTQKWLLAIRPDFHTQLFPDSILRNESPQIIRDVPETNSIHKVYVGSMIDFPLLKTGDNLVIYRC